MAPAIAATVSVSPPSEMTLVMTVLYSQLCLVPE